MKRESKWTRVYADYSSDAPWYIRLVPDFMNVEAAGFGHGISLNSGPFETREAAERSADTYDKFFDMMYIAIIDDHEESK